jgi:hypothetical protein
VHQDRGRLDAAVLRPGPALTRQKGRQGLAGKLPQIMPLEQIGPAARHHQGDEFRRCGGSARRFLGRREQVEPEEAVGLQRQQIGQLADARKAASGQQLDRPAAAKLGKVEFDRLRRARQVGDAEDDLVVEAPQIGDDLAVRRIEKAQAAATKGTPRPTRRDQPLHPVEQRRRRAALGFDVDRLEAINRIHDRRQV